MSLENYPEPTDLELRIEVRRASKDVLSVLSTRGLSLSHELEARVLAEGDVDRLSDWLVRAVTVERAEDIFED